MATATGSERVILTYEDYRELPDDRIAAFRQQVVACEAETFSAAPFPDLRMPLAKLWR